MNLFFSGSKWPLIRLKEFEVAADSSSSCDNDHLYFDFGNMIVNPLDNMNDEYAKSKSDLVLKLRSSIVTFRDPLT